MISEKLRNGTIKIGIRVFLLNWFLAFCSFGYFLIKYKGLLFLACDFDAQELAFHIFTNRAIKSGDIYFNWAIDMGSDFISSFSFYNLGSPFFWISLLFPATLFPYEVGWIFLFKYAVAGLTSYCYLQRYFDRKWCAVLGSVLYAFCGYQAANIVFYHFHDAVAFFPLLLIGLEQLVEEKKFGRLALAVWINALVNWNFFIGEVVFLILYYLIRYDALVKIKEKKWMVLIREIILCLIEGILGIGMAAVIFIPSVVAILSNNRISNHILGANAVSFSSRDYLQLIKALLLPNETLCNQSALAATNWYSIAAYLPAIGISFVVAYVMINKTDWISKLLKVALLFALIPLFNNVFTLFNAESYRRWYYMPILIMVLASAKIMEKIQEDEKTRRIVVRGGMGAFFSILVLSGYLWFYKWSSDKANAINSPKTFLLYLMLGMISLLLVIVLVKYIWNRKYFYPFLLSIIASVGCINIMFNIVRYHQHADWKSGTEAYNEIVRTGENLQSDILPYRYAMADSYYNRNMGSSLTSIDSFISTVDSGIFEFYDAIGKHRHTQTPDGPDGTNELLSVKYYITEKKREKEEASEVYDNGSRKVYVYEEYHAIPIGFTYDSYILESEFKELKAEIAARVMLRTLVVKDNKEELVQNRLEHYDLNSAEEFSSENKEKDISNRKMESSREFEHSTTGFSSYMLCSADKYAFYSVPFSARWSATVNGEPVEILNINGLMAVPVWEGENRIEFIYSTKINQISFIISVVSTILVMGGIFIFRSNKHLILFS